MIENSEFLSKSDIIVQIMSMEKEIHQYKEKWEKCLLNENVKDIFKEYAYYTLNGGYFNLVVYSNYDFNEVYSTTLTADDIINEIFKLGTKSSYLYSTNFYKPYEIFIPLGLSKFNNKKYVYYIKICKHFNYVSVDEMSVDEFKELYTEGEINKKNKELKEIEKQIEGISKIKQEIIEED